MTVPAGPARLALAACHRKNVLLRIVSSLARSHVAVETVADEQNTPFLTSANGDSISAPVSISQHLLSLAGRTDLLGSTMTSVPDAPTQIIDWSNVFLSSTLSDLHKDRNSTFDDLNKMLEPKTFVVGASISLADLALFSVLYSVPFFPTDPVKSPSVIRHYDLIQHIVMSWKLDTEIQSVEFDLGSPFIADPSEDKAADKKENAKGSDAAKAEQPAAKATKESKKDAAAPAGSSKPAKDGKNKEAKKETKPDAKKDASAETGSLPDPSKLDMRVGTVVSVERHPDADSLYVEKIDLGEPTGPRTVVSGLVKYMPESALADRKVVLLCNLKPAKMRGIESQAMVLAATSTDGATVELLDPPADSQNGDVAFFDGYKGTPEKQLNSKKKVWENIQPNLRTDQDRRAVYVVPGDDTAAGSGRVCLLQTDRGACTVKTVVGASIK